MKNIEIMENIFEVMNIIGQMIDGDMDDDLMVIWNQLDLVVANWDAYLFLQDRALK
tara:strand:+ start:44 stop:211 length:168 start_codon:yes stop_codon:yes gene_type:complete